MRTRTTLAIATAAFLTFASAALAAQTFNTPVRLAGGPSGGEPSIATDPRGDVFVSGPQGIEHGITSHTGQGGTGFWISNNDGTTFGAGKYIGSQTGGGDDDVIFSKGAVYVNDLEATATEICKSTDYGKTFGAVGPLPDPFGCTTFNGGQTSPSDDRPWLVAAPDGTLYTIYHEFVSAQPLAFRSDNGGADDFANPCGPIVTDPTIEANVPQDVTGGTLVAHPAVDKQGNLYILFATTTQAENAAGAAAGQPSGTFSQLYLAVSHDKCQSFTDYTVFDGSKIGTNTVQFGDIFNDLAIDGAGNLYAVGTGYIGTKAYDTVTHVYVLSSSDHGKTWTKPFELSTPNAADMMPAAVGGPQAGQLAIGYFRTINGKTSPGDTADKWTYSTAESTDATSSHPSFSYADVNPGYSYHNGDICNLGILCGNVPGQPADRSLADFTSAAIDAQACPLFTFAGNPTGKPGGNDHTNTFNFVTRQLTGCFGATSSTTSTSGAKTRKAKHRKPKKRRPHHRKAKHISRPAQPHARHQGFTG
jgi:hypothetical protein